MNNSKKLKFSEAELWTEYLENFDYYTEKFLSWDTEQTVENFTSIKEDVDNELFRRARHRATYIEFEQWISNKPNVSMERGFEMFFNEEGYLRDDREVVLEAASRNSNLLKYCPERFCDDPEVLLVSVVNDWHGSFSALSYMNSSSFPFIPENVAEGNCYDYESIPVIRMLKEIVLALYEKKNLEASIPKEAHAPSKKSFKV